MVGEVEHVPVLVQRPAHGAREPAAGHGAHAREVHQDHAGVEADTRGAVAKEVRLAGVRGELEIVVLA